MKRENYNSGWKPYKKGQQDAAFLVNLPHDAMHYEPHQPKMKFGGFGGGKTQVSLAQFGQLATGT
jgi:hypothetical protein